MHLSKVFRTGPFWSNFPKLAVALPSFPSAAVEKKVFNIFNEKCSRTGWKNFKDSWPWSWPHQDSKWVEYVSQLRKKVCVCVVKIKSVNMYYIDCRQNCETKDIKEEELHHELLTIRSSRGQCSKEWFRRVLPRYTYVTRRTSLDKTCDGTLRSRKGKIKEFNWHNIAV